MWLELRGLGIVSFDCFHPSPTYIITLHDWIRPEFVDECGTINYDGFHMLRTNGITVPI